MTVCHFFPSGIHLHHSWDYLQLYLLHPRVSFALLLYA
jgi:hypothetical protein